MSSWMPWRTSWYVSASCRTYGAMNVSNELNACAPAHSFCIVPRKLTIWPMADEQCLGAVASTLPATPFRPSWSMSPSRCAAPTSGGYTWLSQ